jgi:hypothetical protein
MATEMRRFAIKVILSLIHKCNEKKKLPPADISICTTTLSVAQAHNWDISETWQLVNQGVKRYGAWDGLSMLFVNID